MIQIAIIGASDASEKEYMDAYILGKLLAKERIILISGGKGGVMEASCKGMKEEGGFVVGIVPQAQSNEYCDVIIRTGLGNARNVLIARSAEIIIAIGGEYGTLSEIALGLKEKKDVFSLNSWKIKGTIECFSPEDVIDKIKIKIRSLI